MKSNQTRSGLWLADLFAAVLLTGITAFFYLRSGLVAGLNQDHPYLSGFVTFGVLSTFGEALSSRIGRRRWLPDKLVLRALLWGVLGVWITAAFPFTDGGVRALGDAGLWPTVYRAFSTSLWANLLSGFAFFMMMTQFWLSGVLDRGFHYPWQVFERPEFPAWARTVLISLVVFWLPAHTITFLLPPDWRIVFAAYLGISLGMILTFSARGGAPAPTTLAP